MKAIYRVIQVTVPLVIGVSLVCLALEESGWWADAFRWAHPFALDWPDRRPIGSLFLARDATGWPRNPRGWFNDASLNLFTVAGRERFAAELWARADAAIANLRAVNAQGIILWDLEGEQFPHPHGSFAGDPTNLEKLAPEMAAVADALFARFRSARLRVGLCVRPQTPAFRPDGSLFQSEPLLDRRALFRTLDRKIGYARNRWGCTLFYVDSNFGFGNLGLHDAAVFRQLHQKYPDVLLIPQHENLAYFAVSAPYYEPDRPEKWPGTRRLAQDAPSLYAHAFSVINVADLPVTPAWRQRLRRWVKAGNVLLFRAWLQGNDLDLVRDAYNQPADAETGPGHADP